MRFQRSVYLAVALAMAALVLSLPGCHKNSDWAGEPYEQKRVAYQAEAGASHVAVLAVAPWDQYVEALQPNFTMNAEAALAAVDTVSAVTQHRQMVGNQAKFKLALSAGSQEPGDASQAPDPQGIGPFKLDQMPAPGIPEGGLAVDPATRYRSATALIQRVQILNRYLRDAVKREGYNPYLVVLQISLMPRARNMPYDAYTMISLFQEDGSHRDYPPENPCKCKEPKQDSGEDADTSERRLNCWRNYKNWPKLRTCSGDQCQLPIVIPLLATDSLEVALADRGQEFLSGLSLGLSASAKGIGGSAGLESLVKKLRASTSKDLNSLFSVAQVSDNTLRVRMGAYRQGPNAYAMVPRTHNVSALLLVPKAYFGGKERTEIRLRSITTFMDASTGVMLQERRLEDVIQNWKDLSAEYHVDSACLLNLMDAVYLNNRERFLNLAQHAVNPKMIDFLWLDLLEGRCGAQAGILSFEVPCLPPPATAWLEDDGKTTAASVLVQKKRFFGSGYKKATLLIRTQSRELRLPAAAGPEPGQGGLVNASFKSLRDLGLASGELKDNLVLRISWQECKDDKLHKRHLDYNCYYRPAPAPAATLTIKESSKVIIASGGRGDLGLDYELKNKAKEGRITIKGGSIDPKKSTAGKGAKIVNSSTLKVSRNGSAVLNLYNLDPDQKVVLTPGGDNNKGGALELEVREAGKGKQSSAQTPENKPGQTAAAK